MTMAAVVSPKQGQRPLGEAFADVRVDAPAQPTGRDVLVKIRAVSVNPIDTKQRALGSLAALGEERALAAEHAHGRILGWDAAGSVIAVGPEVTGVREGDAVFYAGALTRAGSNAEFQVVDERLVAHAPTSVGWAEAASLPLTSLTAWECMVDKFGLYSPASSERAGVSGGVRVGEAQAPTVLILGGAGGVGSAAIQMFRALTPARVIATASRPESQQWVRDLGAHEVVDHRAPDLAAQVLSLCPGGVDYVLSTNSEGRVGLFAEIVAPFGQIVAIDNPAGHDLLPLKRTAISWHWVFMFARALHGYDMQAQGRALAEVAALVDSGRMRPTLTRTLHGLNAENLRVAHELVERGSMIGKVVITA